VKTLITIISLILFGMQSHYAADKVVPLGKKSVHFSVIQSPAGPKGPIFLSLHSNEQDTVAAARQAIRSHPGTLILIDGDGQRRLTFDADKSIDPNRSFSLQGVTRDLNRFSHYTPAAAKKAAAFGSKLIRKLGISRNRPIISLHNNTDCRYSILSYQSGGSEAGSAAAVFRSPDKDPDNFFLVTNGRLFQYLKKEGFNVVLQDNRKAPDDGSLSVYCGKKGILYINVETEIGDSRSAAIMLESLLRLLERSS